MPNEFIIRNGFVAKNNSTITGSLTVTGSTTSDSYTFPSSSAALVTSNQIENWYLSGESFYVGGQELTPGGLFFKPDGSKLYVVGSTNDRIYAYDVTSSWDLGSAVYNGEFSLSLATYEATPNDIYIKNDGTSVWIIGNASDRVVEYTASVPWDISTLTFVKLISVVSQDGAPLGLYFSSDGTKMYIAGSNTDRIYEYNLSTPWDIATAVIGNSLNVGGIFTNPQSITFSENGDYMWIVGSGIDLIAEYYLSTPWDITTATYSGESFPVVSSNSNPTGLFYSEASNKMYIVGSTTDTVNSLYINPQLSFAASSSVFEGTVIFKEGLSVPTTKNSLFNGPIIANSTFTSNGQATFNNLPVQINTGLTAVGNVSLANNTGNDLNFANSVGSQFANILNTGTFNAYKYLRILNGSFGSENDFFIGGSGGGEVNIYSTAQKFEHSGSIYIGRNLEVSGSLPDINTTYNLPTGSAILYDTFTEASNTLLDAHTPDTGSSWYHQFSGSISATVRVRGGLGQAGPTTTIGDIGAYYLSNTTPTVNDYQVSLNIAVFDGADDVLWLLARWQDNDNFYAVRWSSTIGQILKKVGGTWTLLGSTSSFITGTNTVLTLRLIGNTLSIFQNNKYTFSVTDSDLTNSGSVGLGFGNLGYISSDDFDVTWQVNNFTLSEITAATIQTFNNQYSNSYIENGNVGIGTARPVFKLDVSGSARVTNNLTVTGSLTVITGSAIEFQVNQTGVKVGNSPTDSHTITGSVSISSSFSTSSAALSAYKSGSTVLDIQGSQGQLFSVVDSLTGSLMSVNDVSGLPILEVFSDDRVVMGTYGTPAIIISGSVANVTGSLVTQGQTIDPALIWFMS
jgi:hypothetical protein